MNLSHPLFSLLVLFSALFLAACGGGEGGSPSGGTCERKLTTYSLVSYNCSSGELKSSCKDVDAGASGGTEAYWHGSASCSSLGYTEKDTGLSSSEIKIYDAANGGAGATGYFANPGNFGGGSGGTATDFENMARSWISNCVLSGSTYFQNIYVFNGTNSDDSEGTFSFSSQDYIDLNCTSPTGTARNQYGTYIFGAEVATTNGLQARELDTLYDNGAFTGYTLITLSPNNYDLLYIGQGVNANAIDRTDTLDLTRPYTPL